MRDLKLSNRARAMRSEMTEPETRLWLKLHAGRLHGVKFRRQKVIGPFIADFASNAPKLVIEVDGHTHDVDDRRDAERTKYLEGQGYRVMRYTNLEVMRNLDGVLEHLTGIIEEMRRSPLPTLSPEGERAISPSPFLLQGRGSRRGGVPR